MTAQCNADIKAAEQELAELREQQESSEEFRANMEHLRKVLRDAEKQCQTEAITKDFVDTFIDKIYVTPEDNNTLHLDIKIFTGETCEKHLKNLRRQIAAQTDAPQAVAAFSPEDDSKVPAGHTFKKMIESYEKNL